MPGVPPPHITQFGLDTYNWLEPEWAGDDQRGYPLMVFMGGIGEAFREVEEVCRAREGRDPWQQALDIDVCPDYLLPWLGQFVGVTVTPGANASDQRAQIRAEGGFGRGTPAALINAVTSTLTGMQRTQLLERSVDTWTMLLVTDPTETPDVAKTTRVAMAAKDAGLILTLAQSSTPFWFQGSRTFAAAPNTYASATLAQVT